MDRRSHFQLFKTCLQGSAVNFSESLYKCVNFQLNRGIYVNYITQFNDYNPLGMGCGIQALEDIPKDVCIFKAPLDSGLNGIELIDFKLDDSRKFLYESSRQIAKKFFPDDELALEKFYQVQVLMWQIFLNAQNKEAFNSNFVDSFPTNDLTHPTYTSTEILSRIRSRNLHVFLLSNRGFLRQFHETVKQNEIFDVPYEDFCWAYHVAISRRIIIIHEETKMPYSLILPIIDYINHSSTQYNVDVSPLYESAIETSYLTVNSIRPIKAGEQLFFNYGDLDNKTFMARYGFFDVENPLKQTSFIFADTEQKMIEEILGIGNSEVLSEFIRTFKIHNDAKLHLMRKNEVSQALHKGVPYNLTLYTNKFDTSFLKFLRIAYLNVDDFAQSHQRIYSHDFSSSYSTENERKVWTYIKFMIEGYLNPIKHRNHKDLIMSLGMIDKIEKFKEKNWYLLEQEEKEILEKNLTYVNKKLINNLN